MINARAVTRAIDRKRERERRKAARVRGVTDNVIREKGKANAWVRITSPRGMSYGQRGTRYYSREAVTGEIAPLPRRASSRSGLGPGRFIHLYMKSMRVYSVGIASQLEGPPHRVGLNPES